MIKTQGEENHSEEGFFPSSLNARGGKQKKHENGSVSFSYTRCYSYITHLVCSRIPWQSGSKERKGGGGVTTLFTLLPLHPTLYASYRPHQCTSNSVRVVVMARSICFPGPGDHASPRAHHIRCSHSHRIRGLCMTVACAVSATHRPDAETPPPTATSTCCTRLCAMVECTMSTAHGPDSARPPPAARAVWEVISAAEGRAMRFLARAGVLGT